MRVFTAGIIVTIAVMSLSCWRNAEPAQNVIVEQTPVEVPQFTDAATALAEGDRLFDENQTDAAIAAYEQAIALNPELGEAHFKLGIAYALQEHQQEQTGERLPGEVTTNTKTYKTRSDKAFEKAAEALEKHLKNNPDDVASHYFLGMTYSKLNKDEEAEKEFKRAVELNPDDTEYQTELGSVLIKLAQYYEAVKVLKKAVELDPANDRAIALLEDAEAGKRRVEYIQKNTNTASNRSTSNANANLSANSNTAPTANRPTSNTRPSGNATPPPRERVVPTPRRTPSRP